MEALVGKVPSGEKRNKKLIIERQDGSWLAEAFVDIDELKRALM